ncbi:MAG TPA: ATP-binding protein, partial [Gallionella sp.]|nr:ATP-binding protein [Gallionella sp.]
NLLSNAIKFTGHGKVTLSVSRATPSRLAFAVKDTGVGIAEADRETIFQSFEQVGDAHQRLGGSGLGLTISRQLVRLMGGDIQVESRVGEGSTFRFEVDLPAVAIAPVALLPAQIATGYAGPRRKVLIVDEVAESRAVEADLLDQMGFVTLDACDGNEALEVAQSALPDLILMDAAIPGLEWCETISRLRKSPDLARVPVIVLSATSEDCDERHFVEFGASAFLPRPVDHDKLLAQIASLLNLEWTSTMPTGSAAAAGDADSALVAPPQEEMQTLHRLALLGNMRDIVQHAERIAALDPRYQPFAARLRQLASGYQSKAILALVEEHLS